MSAPVRYGSRESFGQQTLRRRLGEVVDGIVILVRDMGESPEKRALNRELSSIGDAVRALETRLLGPHGCVRAAA
jgi:hypothetical protein